MGKKKKAVTCKKRRWFLSPIEWDLLKSLCTILEGFQSVTLAFSRAGVPTICLILPLYKYMETHMNDSVRKHCKPNQAQLQLALGNGLKKLNVYMEKALLSKYPLLGAVLHPSIQLKYFKDNSKWDAELLIHA
ncbi:hypothetical protein A0H81_12662 [Grifola frondosa]|uniref:Uncharacterized protein n=1 Tax=Grifola frondosa TaxID=5627 RepID=A0A1C7LXE3_GRIFR|nr:hypothetical protein A0H81_12662 [Grifola frondosa]